jgi:hypothetical protein
MTPRLRRRRRLVIVANDISFLTARHSVASQFTDMDRVFIRTAIISAIYRSACALLHVQPASSSEVIYTSLNCANRQTRLLGD